jgi:hypothetical protein
MAFLSPFCYHTTDGRRRAPLTALSNGSFYQLVMRLLAERKEELQGKERPQKELQEAREEEGEGVTGGAAAESAAAAGAGDGASSARTGAGSSKYGRDWVLYLDSDAHLRLPRSADLVEVLAGLPVRQGFRGGAAGRASSRSQTRPVGRMYDVLAGGRLAVVVAREYSVKGVIQICDNCQYNTGVMMFNLAHPLLLPLLQAWWDSASGGKGGVCDPRFLRRRLYDQACFDRLVQLNDSSGGRWGGIVGEMDYLTMNTPAGRIVRHSWQPTKDQFGGGGQFRRAVARHQAAADLALAAAGLADLQAAESARQALLESHMEEL